MKICMIYDIKGNVPCFVGVYPSVEVLRRELMLASRRDSDLIYSRFPAEYDLVEFDVDGAYNVSLVSSLNFSHFICNDEVGEKDGDEKN